MIVHDRLERPADKARLRIEVHWNKQQPELIRLKEVLNVQRGAWLS
ncbi:MAG: hypothetical protein OEV08_08290 [Nitrospira sp.]|nr:hypothetical protein [Nitrospira sp.]